MSDIKQQILNGFLNGAKYPLQSARNIMSNAPAMSAGIMGAITPGQNYSDEYDNTYQQASQNQGIPGLIADPANALALAGGIGSVMGKARQLEPLMAAGRPTEEYLAQQRIVKAELDARDAARAADPRTDMEMAWQDARSRANTTSPYNQDPPHTYSLDQIPRSQPQYDPNGLLSKYDQASTSNDDLHQALIDVLKKYAGTINSSLGNR